MISFEKATLENGLVLLVNRDNTTPMVAFNLLYKVGSRDEHPGKTGFAHLFEHLMFEGSRNVPGFDRELEKAGGENNAFTNNDLTDYYISIPRANIETAFWLESDRMLAPAFSEERLKIQKQVVAEEYRQRYLNQPYGDAWLHLRPQAYRKHPYRWPTIGRDIAHIEQATMEEVRRFFYAHYSPDNAILSVSGDITMAGVLSLAEKWFGPVPPRHPSPPFYPEEPVQKEERRLTLERKVPHDALYKVWHMPGRMQKDYYQFDLISDLLANGRSARLYRKLVQEKRLFVAIDAFVTGDIDPGLLVVNGRLKEGVSPEQGEEALLQEIEKLREAPVPEKEITKVHNKFEAGLVYSRIQGMQRALSLAMYEMISDASLVNKELQAYRSAGAASVMETARRSLVPANCTTLIYKALKN